MTAVLRYAGRVYLLLLMVLIMAPAVVVLVDSFNAATSFPSPFEAATLHWYAALRDHVEFLDAAWTSIKVAVIAASVALVAGFLAAYALARGRMRGRNAITTALMGPLLVPELVVGLAILQLVGLAHLPLGLFVLVAAHSVFVLPLSVRLSLGGLSRFDFDLEEAARSLGATRPRVLWLVTLPLLKPNLIAGFVLSVVLSFVNLPLSMFLTTAQTATLPVIAFAYMESRIDPMIAAVATLIMLAATAVAIAVDRVLRVRLVEESR
ncbi:ABC transporter permease [Rhodopila sp.]|uniref:ABC transporter permease n=1 Tax=Rhodopila sp. TaxID=2480087 RepID=UPI003D0A0387